MVDLGCLSFGLPEDIGRLVTYGDFDKALELIELRLKGVIPKSLRERLEFEKLRIERLRGEYIYSFEEALRLAQARIRDFTPEELVRLKDEGYADWAYVKGEVMFHDSFLGNIIKTRPELKERLLEPEDNDEESRLLDSVIDDIIQNGHKSYYIRIKAGLRLKGVGVRPSEVVKVHIPIPLKCQQTRNIKILKTTPEAKFIAPEDYPQRTVYFEKIVSGKEEFLVEYSYENHIKYTALDYNRAIRDEYDFDTHELLPHIAFTPYIRSLAEEIVGDEKNPLKAARRIYDFITMNIKYSYVREYSTIENISEYAALNLKGDCGVQALLFITLCRLSGIPARWQSGLYVTPYSIGPHDWAQFYVEPYGWLFADPSFGGSAYRRGHLKRWNFYFGNLDPFRMPANSEFQHDFMPVMDHLRADPYDSQRGEAEYQDCGVYFDGMERIMKVLEIREVVTSDK